MHINVYFVVLHLGSKALLGLGLYVSKALDAEPADLDKPDDTAEQIKKEITHTTMHTIRVGTENSAETTHF